MLINTSHLYLRHNQVTGDEVINFPNFNASRVLLVLTFVHNVLNHVIGN